MQRSSLVRFALSVLVLLCAHAGASTAWAHGSGYRPILYAAPPPCNSAPPSNRTAPPAGITRLGRAGKVPATPTWEGPSAVPTGARYPGGAGGTSPGMAPLGGPASVAGAGAAPSYDAVHWGLWWRLNREFYLERKLHIETYDPETISDGFFLGRGERGDLRRSFVPTEDDLRTKVLPALVTTLQTQGNDDILSAALIALAKAGRGENARALTPVLARFLSHESQEVHETAALALGILGHPESVTQLEALALDLPEGRRLAGSTGREVDVRTRSFAIYGLGLLGGRTENEDVRRRIVGALHRTLEGSALRTTDIEVAAVVAMGLVPVKRAAMGAAREVDATQPPSASRGAQIEYVLGLLNSPVRDNLVRAQCPTTLARLLVDAPPSSANDAAIGQTERVLEALLEPTRLDRVRDSSREVLQGSIIALGLAASCDLTDEMRKRVRNRLEKIPDLVRDQEARSYSMISIARAGISDADGAEDALDYLVDQLTDGSAMMRPWAAFGLGVLAHELENTNVAHRTRREAAKKLRRALSCEKNPMELGALAIAAGIFGDAESILVLRKRLDDVGSDDARGFVAIALGLLDARDAKDDVRKLVLESAHRPDLLQRAAISLGLLGDKNAVPALVETLNSAKSVVEKAAVASALGMVGDRRALDPLVAMLRDPKLSETSRAFAAVAIGSITDADVVPWQGYLARGLNYAAAPPTLLDATSGAGVLNIQ